MYVMAAMAIASLFSSNSARNAEMKAKAADAKLQRARLERARTSSVDALTSTSRIARSDTQRREIEIESNRIDAESKVDETFAGSGISGTSVSEIDSELEAAVVKNKFENTEALDKHLAAASKDHAARVESYNREAEQVDTKAAKVDVLGDIGKAVGAADSSMAIGAKIEGAIGSFFESSDETKSVGDYTKFGSSLRI